MIRYILLTLLTVASFVNAMLLLGFALEDLELPWWDPLAGVGFAVAIPTWPQWSLFAGAENERQNQHQ